MFPERSLAPLPTAMFLLSMEMFVLYPVVAPQPLSKTTILFFPFGDTTS